MKKSEILKVLPEAEITSGVRVKSSKEALHVADAVKGEGISVI